MAEPCVLSLPDTCHLEEYICVCVSVCVSSCVCLSVILAPWALAVLQDFARLSKSKFLSAWLQSTEFHLHSTIHINYESEFCWRPLWPQCIAMITATKWDANKVACLSNYILLYIASLNDFSCLKEIKTFRIHRSWITDLLYFTLFG